MHTALDIRAPRPVACKYVLTKPRENTDMTSQKTPDVGINTWPLCTVQFTVQGNCPFPLDMLRFACAWPATAAAAAEIIKYRGGGVRGEITLVTDRGFGGLPEFNAEAKRHFAKFGWVMTCAKLIDI